MSRDIFVQDIPASATQVDDIEDDWQPSALVFGQPEAVDAVRELAPDSDFSDPSWIQVELEGASIDISIGDEVPLRSFALHVRGPDAVAANRFISALLGRLDVRAFDPESPSGIYGG